MEEGNKNRFKYGDRVFAKVKGHPSWPAIVDSVDRTNKIIKYNVIFYGTEETACVKEIDVCSFLENKSRLGSGGKNKNFAKAMKEAERSLDISCNINTST